MRKVLGARCPEWESDHRRQWEQADLRSRLTRTSRDDTFIVS